MPHWSFGVRYIHQLVRQSMGHSRIFEVMFPGDPCHAYLMDGNTIAENTLVTAHVLGHADFLEEQRAVRPLPRAGRRQHHRDGGRARASHPAGDRRRRHRARRGGARRRARARIARRHGQELHRETVSDARGCKKRAAKDRVPAALRQLPEAQAAQARKPRSIPQRPGAAASANTTCCGSSPHYAPDLEQWERDIFLSVRAESLYFYPVFACQIMNEGWASYWHARLLREAEFLPQPLYLSAIKAHSDVVRPFAADEQTALQVNPYHLGFTLWERSSSSAAWTKRAASARRKTTSASCATTSTRELAEKLDLFAFEAKNDGEIRVVTRDLNAIREAILAPKFNYGAPRIAVTEMRQDGTLVLTHDHATDGRGLDVTRGNRVIQYIRRVWRRPVR
jgi:stage V sporulation protein R